MKATNLIALALIASLLALNAYLLTSIFWGTQ
jgi:hypothetical protein